MNKNKKHVRRPAGIPLSISLKPRPSAGNDLASDIFRAVRDEEKKEDRLEGGEVETVTAAPATAPPQIEPAPAQVEKPALKASLPTPRPKRSPVKTVSSVNTIGRRDPVERLFEKSKAKELYDMLLDLTHRSENPTDKVRVPRSYLLANTSIKTRITLDQNLKRLEELGLIKRTSIIGEQEGNLYQVNLPETTEL